MAKAPDDMRILNAKLGELTVKIEQELAWYQAAMHVVAQHLPDLNVILREAGLDTGRLDNE